MRLSLGTIVLMLAFGCSRSPAPPAVPSVDLSRIDSFLSQTISNAQSAARANPQSASAWGELAQALEAAEFQPEARQSYQRAAELDPQSARWLYLLSLTQIQDHPALALTNLGRAAQLAPATNDAIRVRLAQLLVERGQLAEAEPHLRQLLRDHPNHPAALVELARLKLATSDPAAVSDLLAPALTNAYTARAALLLLGQARQRLGDSESAALLARRAASLPKPFAWPDPYLREVQSLRGTRQNRTDRANFLLMQGRFDEAEELLAQLPPDDPEALLLMGRMRTQQRQCDQAEAILLRHLAVRTNSLQGFVQLGLARFCAGRWAASAEAFRSAVAVKPDFAQAHYNLGLALARQGDSPGAIDSFQTALHSQPGDAAAHAALAEEYLRTGDAARAREQASAALRIDPKQAKALRVMEKSQPE